MSRALLLFIACIYALIAIRELRNPPLAAVMASFAFSNSALAWMAK